MDYATLERLASHGFETFSKAQLVDLYKWCWDHCLNTGDARFCVISRVIQEVEMWWNPEEGVTGDLLQQVSEQLSRLVTDSLTAPDAASGAQIAHQQGMELAFPRTPAEWRAGGLWI